MNTAPSIKLDSHKKETQWMLNTPDGSIDTVLYSAFLETKNGSLVNFFKSRKKLM